METIDPTALPNLPAPFWFIEFFKVLGFVLHMVPMNLWYAGTLLAVWLAWRGSPPARRFSERFMKQLPILIALGINFGIVPLLFLQVAYSRAFYPATILMAWFWLAIVVLLIPAYYGAYAYSFGLRDDGRAMTPWKKYAGWAAAVMFLIIGFLFANGLSLTTRGLDGWRDLWLSHNVGGAATGTALNVGDATLWPRWLLMFGLALVTVAAWTALDATWLTKKESDEYLPWASRFSTRLALAGAIWATVAGAWYVLFGWRTGLSGRMFGFPAFLLTLPTMAAPWAPVAVLWFWRRGQLDRTKAAAVAGAQVAVLALNAIARQVVQNVELELGGVFQPGVSMQPVATEWGSLILFLGTFVAGVGVIAWILAQIAKASPSETVQ